MNNKHGFNINNGQLEIGGCNAVELAKKYGTPLYVMDRNRIEQACSEFTAAAERFYGDALVLYASKAFSTLAIYQIVGKMGLGCDVVSAGELYTAIKAGFDASKVYLHGNNKLDYELEMAVENKIHCVVIDNEIEIDRLNTYAKQKGITQGVMLRVNPGVEAHTHHYIQTARTDSKFGTAVDSPQILELLTKIKAASNLKFLGFHMHIGSQIFESEPYAIALDILCELMKTVKDKLDIECSEINLGGGFGVYYTEEDKPIERAASIEFISKTLLNSIKSRGLVKPRLVIEPGRSIVAEAGVTLYTVGAIKDIEGVKKYLSVDGGMFDNPRFALYQAKYNAVLADRADQTPTEVVTIAGKCCESGDILIETALLPRAQRGDILAVFTTGAYNFSMASNYNRNFIPAVVLAQNGNSQEIVRKQTLEDIISRDILLK